MSADANTATVNDGHDDTKQQRQQQQRRLQQVQQLQLPVGSTTIIPGSLYTCSHSEIPKLAKSLSQAFDGQPVRVFLLSEERDDGSDAVSSSSSIAAADVDGEDGLTVSSRHCIRLCYESGMFSECCSSVKDLCRKLGAYRSPFSCFTRPPPHCAILADLDEGASRSLAHEEAEQQSTRSRLSGFAMMCFYMFHGFSSLWDAYRTTLGLADPSLALSVASLADETWELLGNLEQELTTHSTKSRLLARLKRTPTSVSASASASASASSSSQSCLSVQSMFNLLAKSRSIVHRQKLGQILILDTRSQDDYQNGHLRKDTAGLCAANVPLLLSGSGSPSAEIPRLDDVAKSLKNRSLALMWRGWRSRSTIVYGEPEHGDKGEGKSDDKGNAMMVMMDKLVDSVEQQLSNGRVYVLKSPFSNFARLYPFLVAQEPKRRGFVRRGAVWYPVELVPGQLYYWEGVSHPEKHTQLLKEMAATHVVHLVAGESKEHDDPEQTPTLPDPIEGFRNIHVQAARPSSSVSMLEQFADVEAARLQGGSKIVIISANDNGPQAKKSHHSYAAAYMALVRGCSSADLLGSMLEEAHLCLDPDWAAVDSFLAETFTRGGAERGVESILEEPLAVIDDFLYVGPMGLGRRKEALQKAGIERLVLAGDFRADGRAMTLFPDSIDYLTVGFEEINADFHTKLNLVRCFVDACRGGGGKSGKGGGARRVLIVGSTPSKTTCIAAAYLVATDKIGALEAFQKVRSKVPWACLSKDSAYRLEAYMEWWVRERKLFRSGEMTFIPEHMLTRDKKVNKPTTTTTSTNTPHVEKKGSSSSDDTNGRVVSGILKSKSNITADIARQAAGEPKSVVFEGADSAVVELLRWRLHKAYVEQEKVLEDVATLQEQLKRVKFERDNWKTSTIRFRNERDTAKKERDMFRAHSDSIHNVEEVFGDGEEEVFGDGSDAGSSNGSVERGSEAEGAADGEEEEGKKQRMDVNNRSSSSIIPEQQQRTSDHEQKRLRALLLESDDEAGEGEGGEGGEGEGDDEMGGARGGGGGGGKVTGGQSKQRESESELESGLEVVKVGHTSTGTDADAGAGADADADKGEKERKMKELMQRVSDAEAVICESKAAVVEAKAQLAEAKAQLSDTKARLARALEHANEHESGFSLMVGKCVGGAAAAVAMIAALSFAAAALTSSTTASSH
mmetsp:Transcript_1385/g.2342  ORF Transcript_1385/g.2342 Transcript_1385/m.2342 type:complete len:1187 (-) Transcript_1385:81-3641(-)|eukprot:CAMPEP_0197521436 /NCGR_PEP_ID=MMETSP1318-20131121/6713_1 /TAXON_ID=552666 /ORGANISM="Partenskyella glossopodia, Strain RCC365" /LENGTH=1186 /DNA_ID=CAMNT_0043073435 /DNA_START=136 /DNA_END=3696 /DNA_ORIENTATION=+